MKKQKTLSTILRIVGSVAILAMLAFGVAACNNDDGGDPPPEVKANEKLGNNATLEDAIAKLEAIIKDDKTPASTKTAAEELLDDLKGMDAASYAEEKTDIIKSINDLVDKVKAAYDGEEEEDGEEEDGEKNPGDGNSGNDSVYNAATDKLLTANEVIPQLKDFGGWGKGWEYGGYGTGTPNKKYLVVEFKSDFNATLLLVPGWNPIGKWKMENGKMYFFDTSALTWWKSASTDIYIGIGHYGIPDFGDKIERVFCTDTELASNAKYTKITTEQP